jgi:hypothetical protein
MPHLAMAQEPPEFPRGTGQGHRAIEALLQAAGLDVPRDFVPESLAPGHAQSFVIRWDTGEAQAAAWIAAPLDAPIPAGRFTLAALQPASGPVQRQRLPQLSPEHLVVAVVDGFLRLQSWTMIPDPRLLRAELPDEQGELRGQLFYHSTAELSVTLPAAPSAAELHVYQPRWDGQEFTLEPLATIVLP